MVWHIIILVYDLFVCCKLKIFSKLFSELWIMDYENLSGLLFHSGSCIYTQPFKVLFHFYVFMILHYYIWGSLKNYFNKYSMPGWASGGDLFTSKTFKFSENYIYNTINSCGMHNASQLTPHLYKTENLAEALHGFLRTSNTKETNPNWTCLLAIPRKQLLNICCSTEDSALACKISRIVFVTNKTSYTNILRDCTMTSESHFLSFLYDCWKKAADY